MILHKAVSLCLAVFSPPAGIELDLCMSAKQSNAAFTYTVPHLGHGL